MKAFGTLWIAVLVTGLLSHGPAVAQIPNAGFESWSGGEPLDWLTSNIPGTVTGITESNDAHSGLSALRGEIADFMGTPWLPWIASFNQFPITMRHGTFHGWYKLTTVSPEDSLNIGIFMNSGINVIGAGALNIGGSQGSYTEFTVDIFYFDPATPDACVINIGLFNFGTAATVGSFFLLDDLSLGLPTSVEDGPPEIPSEVQLSQNYPNPFNPTTVIGFQLPASGQVELSVFDLLGQKVETLVAGYREAGSHNVRFNAEGLPSGMYLYRLRAGEFVQTRKLILMK